jgi:hypothetical protein
VSQVVRCYARSMEPIIFVDQYIVHSEEAPPRTDYFDAWYVDASGDKYSGEGQTWESALAALPHKLWQQGFDLDALPQARKGETFHV